MDQIIVTTLIKSEHIRMDEQLNRRPLVDAYPQREVVSFFASFRSLFRKKQSQSVARDEAVCCVCSVPRQV